MPEKSIAELLDDLIAEVALDLDAERLDYSERVIRLKEEIVRRAGGTEDV